MKPVRIAVLLVLAGLLAGCGFHLRGAQPLPEGWQVVVVKDVQHLAGRSGAGTTWYGGDRAELQRTVEQALAEGGFTLADDAALSVELLGEQVVRRTSAIGAAANAAEYQLEYELRYRVVDGEQQVRVPEQRIQRDRIYRYNETAPMGSADEEALIRREMRTTAARQLVQGFRRQALRAATAAPAPAQPAGRDETAAP